MQLTELEINELQVAKNLLENPGLAARITNLVGTPIEKGFKLLPKEWNGNIGDVTKAALMKAWQGLLERSWGSTIFSLEVLPTLGRV